MFYYCLKANKSKLTLFMKVRTIGFIGAFMQGKSK